MKHNLKWPVYNIKLTLIFKLRLNFVLTGIEQLRFFTHETSTNVSRDCFICGGFPVKSNNKSVLSLCMLYLHSWVRYFIKFYYIINTKLSE